MPRGSDVRLGLTEFLTDLEAELGKARSQADERNLAFRVDGATLEVDVSYSPTESPDAPTGAKLKFWIVESAMPNTNDAARSAHRHTLRLSVHLNRWPQTADTVDSEVESLPLPPAPVSKATKR